jgi:hypothetical protein
MNELTVKPSNITKYVINKKYSEFDNMNMELTRYASSD